MSASAEALKGSGGIRGGEDAIDPSSRENIVESGAITPRLIKEEKKSKEDRAIASEKKASAKNLRK